MTRLGLGIGEVVIDFEEKLAIESHLVDVTSGDELLLG
jgi:hypothetical protein